MRPLIAFLIFIQLATAGWFAKACAKFVDLLSSKHLERSKPIILRRRADAVASHSGSGYCLQDLHDQQNKSQEMTLGDKQFFALHYIPSDFNGKFRLLEMTMDQSFGTDGWIVKKEIAGFGSLSNHDVGSSEYKNKYHSDEVPTLSCFGCAKTPIVSLKFLQGQSRRQTPALVAIKPYGPSKTPMPSQYSALASVELQIILPEDCFGLLSAAIENNQIHACEIYVRISGDGIYRKTIETSHFKILFDFQQVSFAEDRNDIFNSRRIEIEESRALSRRTEAFYSEAEVVRVKVLHKKTLS